MPDLAACSRPQRSWGGALCLGANQTAPSSTPFHSSRSQRSASVLHGRAEPCSGAFVLGRSPRQHGRSFGRLLPTRGDVPAGDAAAAAAGRASGGSRGFQRPPRATAGAPARARQVRLVAPLGARLAAERGRPEGRVPGLRRRHASCACLAAVNTDPVCSPNPTFLLQAPHHPHPRLPRHRGGGAGPVSGASKQGGRTQAPCGCRVGRLCSPLAPHPRPPACPPAGTTWRSAAAAPRLSGFRRRCATL